MIKYKFKPKVKFVTCKIWEITVIFFQFRNLIFPDIDFLICYIFSLQRTLMHLLFMCNSQVRRASERRRV